MDDRFMEKLDTLRERVGFPLHVNSGYRCPEHNKAIKGGPAHPAGKAADLSVHGEKALYVVREATALGFTGIGVAQKGGARFIHVDTYDGPDAPRPWIWSY